MKYSDLIQFEPIERIIQLRDANKAERAKTFVSTYVISDVMAERLKDIILPQMRIDQPGDAKGLLVVGNYGTGKSHMMSVLSAVAEHGELLDSVNNVEVKAAAQPIAGQFKVIRMELGSTKMELREAITQNIEKQLREWEIDFKFPADDEVSENKTSFENLMVTFDQTFPGKGLLIVVDELLDYLRSRNQQALTLDLGFLREIGEVCKDLRFRFIAGVQEAIFDSDRFAFVAESLSRVKDRFDQIRIQKTDITYVVANRLLKKSEHQKAKIRAYLEPFAKFYDGWTENLSEFVDLFPVHPNYVSTFERLPIVEQRGVLQVLSNSFEKMADQELPMDHPGLLALDSFWSFIKGNPHFRTNDDLKATIECADILASKVETGFPKNRKQYKGMAARIIDGLSVHRLTTSNINAPIGMTPEEIRDQLCIYHPLVAEMGGADPSEDLLTLVDVALKEIKNSVSGQFISQNDDNRQWFLDLKKTEDFDALIEKRVESLDDESLDIAYFDVLAQVMEATDASEFSGFRIWESSMPWKEKNVTKLGWLFFGVPCERSTAQPPRDFYVYFPQIINPPKFTDEKRADEVFFRVDAKDEKFRVALGRYAAAIALRANASGSKKLEYAKKVEQYFKELSRWLRDNFLSKVNVSYQGSTKTLATALAGENAAGKTTREQVFLAASNRLNGHFEDICGEYPKFSRQLTFGRHGNIEQAVQDALRGLHTPPTQSGVSVLDGLGLMDADRIDPRNSPYAKFIAECIAAKGHGQVLNRSELVQRIDGVDYFIASGKFRLEVELLVVVLGAMVYSGETMLSIPGKDFSATDLPELSTRNVRDLTDFKHLKQPKDWNVPAIKALFELLGLAPGLAVKVTQNDNSAVVQLGTELNKEVEKLVLMRQEFGGGIPFWGTKLLKDEEVAEAAAKIDSAKQFLEGLQAFNTPAKLKNFKYSQEEIEAHRPALDRAKAIEALKAFAGSISDFTSYLSNAQSVLAEGHPWCAKSKALKAEVCEAVLKPENRASADFRTKVLQKLKALKAEYIDLYLEAYRHSRLDLHLDKRKQALLSDAKFVQLRALASIPTMNVSQLTEIQEEFGKLRTGDNITREDMEANPVAGEFYPAMESPEGMSAEQRLTNLEQRIEDTHTGWTNALLNEFDDPVTQDNLKLIDAKDRQQLEDFIAKKELPIDLDSDFVKAVQQALSGLSRVVVTSKSIEAALFPSGAATTIDDFKERFATYLDGLVKGQDRSKVRLVLGSEQRGEQ
jgi:hypothetical protein